MDNISYYNSPLGTILLASDGIGLSGLWFEGQKNYASTLHPEFRNCDDDHTKAAADWLDAYFSGAVPGFPPAMHLTGTEFRIRVWNALMSVPYGETMTYGAISLRLAEKDGKGSCGSAARAVGSAVGHNPISIIIPCHRIVGADGKLCGYAGGVERKKELLRLEGILK